MIQRDVDTKSYGVKINNLVHSENKGMQWSTQQHPKAWKTMKNN